MIEAFRREINTIMKLTHQYSITICLLCLLGLNVSTGLAETPRYTVTDLGPGSKSGQAEAVNNRGQVVGWQDNAAFLWENGTQKIISKQQYQGAHGINTLGQVVGVPGDIQLVGPSVSILSGASAFVWDRGHLEYLPGLSNAYGINDGGDIVGESNNHAVFWRKRQVDSNLSQDRKFIWLSLRSHKIPQPPEYPWSVAYGVNAKGEAVGVLTTNRNNAPEHGRAFRYLDKEAQILPLPVPGSSVAYAINASGKAVGAAHLPGSEWQAALWPLTGPMQALPTLPGLHGAVAHGLNAAGQAVGWSFQQGGPDAFIVFQPSLDTRACLWQDGKVLDLNTAIAPETGWVLQEARAINDKGWIVGGGTLHGSYHAFLLKPIPEETSKMRLKVVAYVPNWNDTATSAKTIDYAKITHLNIAFENPINDAGDLSFQAGDAALIAAAHAHHVPVLLSIAGGGVPDNKVLMARYSRLLSAGQRARFVAKIAAFLTAHKFDGLDVDLEGPAIGPQYGAFVHDLSLILKPQGRLLTAALSQGYGGESVPASVFADLDWVNIMAYDATGPWNPDKPGPHSTLAFAQSSTAYWLGRGLPKSKAVLGLPFYGYGFGPAFRAGGYTYAEIVAAHPGAENTDEVGQTIYYNGLPTIRAKTQYARGEGLAGVMVWSIDQDAAGDRSLLSAIDGALQANPGLPAR